ncbi:unnamed protein product, partial [Heterosigma akashiwo]
GGFIEWPQIPWRRSALEFLFQFYSDDEGKAQGQAKEESDLEYKQLIFSREGLQAELTALDEAIRSVGDEAMDLFAKPTPGTPRSHWWWDFCGTFRGGGFP